MTTQHTYLKTHTISSAVLAFGLAEQDAELKARAEQSTSGRAAKTLVKDGPLRVTLIAMRKGNALRAHQVEGVVSVQVLRGRARVSAEGEGIELATNGLVVLQEEVAHTAEALSDCALLVTVAMSRNGHRR